VTVKNKTVNNEKVDKHCNKNHWLMSVRRIVIGISIHKM